MSDEDQDARDQAAIHARRLRFVKLAIVGATAATTATACACLSPIEHDAGMDAGADASSVDAGTATGLDAGAIDAGTTDAGTTDADTDASGP